MVRYSGSDSDSDRSRRRRRRSKSKSRSDSSSSSYSQSGSRHSYKRKHPPKCKKKHHSRRSRSRDRVRDKRGRERSRSRSRSSSRRNKSRDRDRKSRSSDRRSKSVSPKRTRKKRRRRSRSRSSGSRSSRRDCRSARYSDSNSPNKSPPSSTVSASNSRTGASVSGDYDSEQQLRFKLQRAIEAAKTADEQLRQQGVLPAGSSRSTKREELSALEQLSRANKIEEINDDGFAPKAFHSTRSEKPEKEEIPHVIGDFSFGTQAERLTTEAVEVLNRLGHLDKEGLCHPRLLVDAKQKEDRWLKKLFNYRQKALQGDPL